MLFLTAAVEQPRFEMSVIAFISLTTPWLLGGLALLTLPLMAHWLQRQSQRTIVFPSIALLLNTVARQTRFHRLQRYLLLGLRLLAVVCIVLAFTRPVWVTGGDALAAGDEEAIALVLILDVSASSGQRREGLSELERLKGVAGRQLDELRPGVDVAGVILADAAPQPLFPRLTANLAGLRNSLSQVAATAERADFSGAFAAAGRLLSVHAGPRRVVVLSDLQRDNWSDILSRGSLAEAVPQGTSIAIAAEMSPTAGNVSLTRPDHFPVTPLIGEPFDTSVLVRNHSESVRQLRIVCERRSGDGTGEILGKDEVTLVLQPREERGVVFRVSALDTDRQWVRFEALNEDSLALDNSVWHVIQPAPRMPVLVASDDDPQQPGTTGYYLLRALAPQEGESNRFTPRRIRSSEISAKMLQEAPLLVMGYLGALSAEQAGALAEFVRQGGGLLVYAGDGPVDRNLAAMEASGPANGLLPWLPARRRPSGVGRDPLRLTGGRWQSRWLRLFDEQSQLALEEIHFQRTWTAGGLSPEAEVLLSFEDGSPALGVRSVGEGRILVANFSPDATTSDLARHGAFVALTQMLLQAAVPDESVRQLSVVGSSHVWGVRGSADSDDEWSVIKPDGQRGPLSSRRVEGDLVLTTPRIDEPGIYQLRRGEAVVDAVAFGVDEREGDLTRIPVEEVRGSLAGAGVEAVAVLGGVDEPPTPGGRPLWGMLFTLALCAIGLELLLLGWWRR